MSEEAEQAISDIARKYGDENWSFELREEIRSLLERQLAPVMKERDMFRDMSDGYGKLDAEYYISQARLSEAVKVLEGVAGAGKSWNDCQNMEAFLLISNSIEAAKAFITTLGGEKE